MGGSQHTQAEVAKKRGHQGMAAWIGQLTQRQRRIGQVMHTKETDKKDEKPKTRNMNRKVIVLNY